MLKLVQIDNGVFDLAPEDPDATVDEILQAAIETLIYAILHTDQIAPAGRVADPFDQRGWWHDPQRGTGLWYVRWQALSDKARREALNMVKRALEAKTTSLAAISVADVTPAGNVSSVMLEIAGQHNGHQFIMKTSL